MRKSLLKITLIILFFALFLAKNSAANEPKTSLLFKSEIIAIVDGDPLSYLDLEQFAVLQGIELPKDYRGDTELLEKLSKDMIVAVILEKEAEKAGVAVAVEEIEAYIEEIRKQNKLDKNTFLEMLESRKLDLETYREQVRSDILRTRIVSTRVREKINILDEDIGRYLEENSELLPSLGQVHLQKIQLVTKQDSADGSLSDIVALLRAIRSAVLAGANFSKIAAGKFSDTGYVNLDDLKDNLRQAVQGLDVGGVSEVIVDGDRAILLKLVAVGGEDNKISEELRQTIKSRLFQEKFEEEVNKFLYEDLPKKYFVENKL